jgi:hypothetical protein
VKRLRREWMEWEKRRGVSNIYRQLSWSSGPVQPPPMGQFNCFGPVRSESQKRQRENAKQFKFLTQDSEKVYCRDSMRHKKSKRFYADETGRQKKKLRGEKKFLHEQTAARMRPDSQKKFVAQRRCDRTAKENFCSALHLSVAVTGQKQFCMAP